MFVPEENSKQITMNKGDFGIIFTITITGDLGNSNLRFSVYNKDNGIRTNLIQKDFTQQDINEGKINVSFSKEDSAKLDVGQYYWGLYQYVSEQLKNTLATGKIFEVKEGE